METLMVYYLFSLFFMVGNTKWEYFKSNFGKLEYFILIIIPLCWAILPFIIGEHCK